MLDQDVRPGMRHGWRQGPPWVAAGGVLVLGFVAAYSLGLAQRPAVPDGPVSVPAVSSVQSDVPTASGASELPEIKGDGTFLVGAEVQPGTYESAGSADGLTSCFVERLAGAGGGAILQQELATGQIVITVEASDESFKTRNCQPWTLVP